MEVVRERNCKCFVPVLGGSCSYGHNCFTSFLVQANTGSKTSLIAPDSFRAVLTGDDVGRCFNPYLLHPCQCPAFPAAQHGTVGLLLAFGTWSEGPADLPCSGNVTMPKYNTGTEGRSYRWSPLQFCVPLSSKATLIHSYHKAMETDTHAHLCRGMVC